MLEHLHICQHNAARGMQILQSLFEVAMKEEASLIFVQEPYLFQNKQTQQYHPITHPGFIPILPSTDTRIRPRTITYIKQFFEFEVTPRFDIINDPDLQILELFLPEESFFIIHIYNEKPLNDEETRTTVQRLIDIPIKLQKPFILLGDLNLHHPWWNPFISNPSTQAESFITFLRRYHTRLLNDAQVIEELGGTFHRSHSTSISVIDLAFATRFSNLWWSDWRYAQSTGSDHEVILISAQLNQNHLFQSSLPPKYNLKKADWKLYKNNLLLNETLNTQRLDTAIAQKNTNEVARFMEQTIHDAARLSIPTRVLSSRSKPWWTNNLTQQRQHFHTLRRRAKKFPSAEHIEEARIVRNQYFHAIKTAKNDHWLSFLSRSKGKDIFTAFKYSDPQRHQNPIIPALRYMNSQTKTHTIATSHEDKSVALVESLFPRTMNDRQSNTIYSEACHLHTISTWEWPELSKEELITSIPDKKTAPGADGIHWTMIKEAMITTPDLFYKAYKYLFNIGKHPDQWKKAIGIIIPKRNKKDYSVPKAYRPISLISCLSKVMEKIYARRLAFLANKSSDFLHQSQMGGRKQRSALDAAMLFEEFIQQSWSKKRVVTTVLLDIMGAFDKLQPAKLIEILKQLNPPPSFTNWVKSFLEDRKIQLLFNGQLSKTFEVSGTPQGSPISPLLFLISIRHLKIPYQTPNMIQLSYIDDIMVSYASTSVQKNVQKLEQALQYLQDEADKQSVIFETEKSELIHFHRRRNPITCPLSLHNTLLHPKKEIRWLGFWFDTKLTFKTHANKRLQLANGALERLRGLASRSNGLQFNALRQLYLACVIPVLDYESLLWYGKHGSSSLTTKYEKLQNRAIIFVTGAYRNSPSKALEIEAAPLPTRVRHFKLGLNYALRILRMQDNHPLKNRVYRPLQDESTLEDAFDLGLIECIEHKNVKTQLLRLFVLLRQINISGKLEFSNTTWTPPWQEASLHIKISNDSKTNTYKEH